MQLLVSQRCPKMRQKRENKKAPFVIRKITTGFLFLLKCLRYGKEPDSHAAVSLVFATMFLIEVCKNYRQGQIA
jgi:hypothetical protein